MSIYIWDNGEGHSDHEYHFVRTDLPENVVVAVLSTRHQDGHLVAVAETLDWRSDEEVTPLFASAAWMFRYDPRRSMNTSRSTEILDEDAWEKLKGLSREEMGVVISLWERGVPWDKPAESSPYIEAARKEVDRRWASLSSGSR